MDIEKVHYTLHVCHENSLIALIFLALIPYTSQVNSSKELSLNLEHRRRTTKNLWMT